MSKQGTFAARRLDTVYHVGHLDDGRTKPYTSFEGRGLSVSLCPRDWAVIMEHGGPLFELTNTEMGRFYEADVNDGPRERERAWALENQYVAETEGFRIEWQENGETHYMAFYDRDNAEAEAFEYDADIQRTTLLTLDKSGQAYWDDAFRQDADDASPLMIRDLLPVWFAEAQGFDGVWWDEEHNVAKYSAPRGVIFQSALSEWTYEQVGNV